MPAKLTMPTKSLLAGGRYTSAAATDLAKRFAQIKREQRRAAELASSSPATAEHEPEPAAAPAQQLLDLPEPATVVRMPARAAARTAQPVRPARSAA